MTRPLRIFLVAGARPDFMQVAPITRAMAGNPAWIPRLVHTGEHDDAVSRVFIEELDLPPTDFYLCVSPASHAIETSRIMIAFERLLEGERPDLVLVAGDRNSALACALAAAKLLIPVAHVEAGLRSPNRSMPEELNRLLTDHLSTYLFTPSAGADQNLLTEGFDPARIHRIGNVMIDTLLHHRAQAEIRSHVLESLGLTPRRYAVLTLDRPETVDHSERLAVALKAVEPVAALLPVIYPVYPRTRKLLESQRIDSNLRLREQLGYLDSLRLMDHALFVLTDSGGIQEETTALGVPCLTLRDETERPITVSEGTNIVVGLDAEKILAESQKILRGEGKSARALPELWDGHAAERLVRVLARTAAASAA